MIHELKQKSDVAEKIEEFKSHQDDFQCVMMIAMRKDGSQFMMGSTMSGMERAFLCKFFEAYVHNWFSQLEVEGH